MSSGDPADPISDLAAGVAQIHELFLAYLAGGFTEGRALYLVGQIITASLRGQQP